MNKNKKLSKAIRERKARTGESYSTARMHILAKLNGGGNGDGGRRDGGGDGRKSTPPGPVLGGWILDPNPQTPTGTLIRLREAPTGNPVHDKPLSVVPRGSDWAVYLSPALKGMIQGRFAAPTSEIACLYADDFLHGRGFSGPAVGPLPERYPPLREREGVMVPSPLEPSVLLEGARCGCGYVGLDIRDRHEACPACNGIAVMTAFSLANHLSKLSAL